MPVKPKPFPAVQIAKCSPPGDWDANALFEVEDIVGKRIRYKQLQYQVKWKRYDVLTWEPVSNIVHCVDLIHDYEAVHTPLTDQQIHAQRVAPGKLKSRFEEVVNTSGSIREDFVYWILPTFRQAILL